MGLFDKMKAAAAQAAGATGSMFGGAAADLWVKHGDKVVGSILDLVVKAVAKDQSYVTDDAKYKSAIIDPCWALLPMPIQLIGRERLNWDAMFLSMRAQIFLLDGENASLQPDARDRLMKLILDRLQAGSA